MNHGLGLDTLRKPVELYDLYFDPNEQNNLAGSAEYQGILDDLSERMQKWMEKTNDPLLTGPVPLPPTAQINSRSDLSPDDEPLYSEVVY
jgi:hypothetical protein